MNKYALRQSPLAIAIGSLLAGGSAHAATITVTTAADGPVGSVAGCSLREAIASANAGNSQGGCASGSLAADTIVFDPTLANSTITLTHGVMDITSSLTITGPVPGDPAGLTIDGDNLSRIFHAESPLPLVPITANFNHLTLTRGRATGAQELGGGIYAHYANLNLERVMVTANSVSATGAGPYANALAVGGGLAVRDGSLTLTESTVTGNSTAAQASGDYAGASSFGGGLAVLNGGATIVDSVISDNQSTTEVSGEYAFGIAAGALVVLYGALNVVASTVSGNSAQSQTTDPDASSAAYAGAAFISGLAAVTIVDSTLSDNSAAADDFAGGGGLAITQSHVTLRNSTISGNTATADSTIGGGAMVVGYEDTEYGDHQPGSLTVVHSSLAFNTASNGVDGVYFTDNSQTALLLTNSLIVQGDGGETACSGVADTYDNTLVTDTSCTGTATALGDIGIGGLADNGGPTRTHALLPGSVAIDGAGDCAADAGVTADQRGQPRPGTGSSACDIGAFELQAGDGSDLIFHDRFEE